MKSFAKFIETCELPFVIAFDVQSLSTDGAVDFEEALRESLGVSKKYKIVKNPKNVLIVKFNRVSQPKKKAIPKASTKVSKKTTTQCIKVASLRKELKDETVTLKTWMENPNNVYVGRPGRIFIGSDDEKEIFHYKGSKFANPYKVGTSKGEYTLEESIRLYKKHLKEEDLIEKAKKDLRGKNLGCFCDQKGLCHAKVLAEIVNGNM